MANLKLKNVIKRFGKNVLAVNDINLEVKDGEFLVLLGPSGCGKTTTMRMIAGLEDPTAGSITLDGEEITDLSPRNRNVSMIFQNYAIWPHMTVYENISYALKLKKMPKDEIDKIVNEVAALADIQEYLDRYPRQLSGGQQQRVAVARAIAVKPKVFLMDEPLSNLDAKLRISMRTELKAIHEKTNATTIYVTHDQSEAMSLADRIVIMNKGEIVQIGTPDEVYRDSANIFSADFIGIPPTNFIDVKVSDENNVNKIINPEFSIEFDPNYHTGLKDYRGKELVLGIRPENINIVDKESAVISVDCLLVEPQGSYKIIVVKINDKIVKIIEGENMDIKPGQELHLAFAEKDLLFFDKDTEERI